MQRWPWVRPMLVATAMLFAVGVVAPVAAKDGGGGNNGHGGNGNGGGGNSGHGGGDDSGGDDDGGGGKGGGGDDIGGGGGDDGGDGDSDGRGRGRGRGGGGDWDNSGSSEARGAVSKGVALPLNRVMPLVQQAVPGRVLDVDLQQWTSGAWVYKFLVLSGQGAYSEVFVDALSRRIVRVRER